MDKRTKMHNNVWHRQFFQRLPKGLFFQFLIEQRIAEAININNTLQSSGHTDYNQSWHDLWVEHLYPYDPLMLLSPVYSP